MQPKKFIVTDNFKSATKEEFEKELRDIIVKLVIRQQKNEAKKEVSNSQLSDKL